MPPSVVNVDVINKQFTNIKQQLKMAMKIFIDKFEKEYE
jgi:hypothetical protein